MKLPPPTSVNPRALAEQIRQALGNQAVPLVQQPVTAPGPSPHLVAAAKAAIAWTRERRRSWSDPHIPPAAVPMPAELFEQLSAPESDAVPAEASVSSSATDTVPGSGESMAAWIPRAAVLAAAILLIWALGSCWPRLSAATPSGDHAAPPPGESDFTPASQVSGRTPTR